MEQASQQSLQGLAEAMSTAADREDWETVEMLFGQFKVRLHEVETGRISRADATSALTALNEAIAHTARRRNEIRDLIEKLSGQPL